MSKSVVFLILMSDTVWQISNQEQSHFLDVLYTCWIRRDSSSLSSRVRRRCSSCSRFSHAAWSCTRACCIFSTLSTYTCFFFSCKSRLGELQDRRKENNRVSYTAPKSSPVFRSLPVQLQKSMNGKKVFHEYRAALYLPYRECLKG